MGVLFLCLNSLDSVLGILGHTWAGLPCQNADGIGIPEVRVVLQTSGLQTGFWGFSGFCGLGTATEMWSCWVLVSHPPLNPISSTFL